MPQFYESPQTFSAVSGQPNCLELLAPPHGRLSKLIIMQVDGTLAGYTADLYNREGACGAEPEASSSFDDYPVVNPELHRVCPRISVAAGQSLSSQLGLEYGYENMDEQDIRKTPNSRLWMDVQPSGTGTKTFQIILGVEPWTF